jgi:MFS family permease
MKAPRNEPRFQVGALAAVLLAVSTVSAGYGIVLPILPLMLQVIDGPSATTEVSRHTGLLTGVHALALFLFAPFWGKLSDHYGRRNILCLGLVGFGASLLLSSVKLSIGMLYAERFFTGLFAAGITPVAFALIADQGGSDEWRARRLAWVSMAAISGFLLGPMLSGLLATLSGSLAVGEIPRSYDLPYFTIATVAMIASVVVRLFVPTRVAEAPVQGSSEGLQPHIGDARTILILRAISFLVAAGVGVFEVGLALRGNQELRMPPVQVALMFTVCSLVMFVVQAIVFSPKISPSWTRWLIAPALGVMAVALLLIPATSEYITLLTTVSVVAASAGILSPILTYWTSLESGKTKGAELGKQTAVVSLGQALGSVAGGSLYSFAIIPAAPIVVIALLLAAAAMTALKLPRKLEQRQAPRSELTIAEGAYNTALTPSLKS